MICREIGPTVVFWSDTLSIQHLWVSYMRCTVNADEAGVLLMRLSLCHRDPGVSHQVRTLRISRTRHLSFSLHKAVAVDGNSLEQWKWYWPAHRIWRIRLHRLPSLYLFTTALLDTSRKVKNSRIKFAHIAYSRTLLEADLLFWKTTAWKIIITFWIP